MGTTGIKTAGANVARQIERLANRQVNYAAVQTLNAVAYGARQFVVQKIPQVFDRPIPSTRSSPRYEKAKLVRAFDSYGTSTASVYIDDFSGNDAEVGGRGITTGKKKIPPTRWLAPQVYGGARSLKAFERLMRAKRILPNGLFVVPGAGATLDAFGNLPGSTINLILAWFGAFERYAGDMANMGKKRMDKLIGARSKGFKVRKRDVARPGYSNFNVADGKYKSKTLLGTQLRSGQVVGRLFLGGVARSRHLKPGVYSAKGIHGSDVTPILRFVRQPLYGRRFPFHTFVLAYVKEHFDAEFSKQLDRAVTSAKP
jgi:hypothetical protein